MDSVTVSELNRQTAKVLDRIKAGESLEITEYGRPVARLSPAVPTTGAPLLERLIAQGRAVPAANAGPIPPTPARGAAEEGIDPAAGFHLIVEGIRVNHYGTMLTTLVSDDAGPAFAYYLDIPFGETPERALA